MRYIAHLSHLFLVIQGLKSELKSEIYFTVIPLILFHYVYYGCKNDTLTHTLYLKKNSFSSFRISPDKIRAI